MCCVGTLGGGGRTLAMHEERFPASSRARERRRSYSASLELWEAWLKAGGC